MALTIPRIKRLTVTAPQATKLMMNVASPAMIKRFVLKRKLDPVKKLYALFVTTSTIPPTIRENPITFIIINNY